MAPRIAVYLAGEPEPAPSGGTDSVLAVYQPFETADRSIAIDNDTMWQRFCAAVGLAELATDPALSDNAGRRRHQPRITALVAERLVTRTAADWLRILAEVDVPAALVQTLPEVVKDPQVIARGSLMPVPDSAGELMTVRSLFRLASAAPRNERFPELGANTREVLLGLGYGHDDVTALVAEGVIAEGAAEGMVP
ncbi:CoA transferase [Nocardia sp. R16R-3T]